jgi:chemotaxis protein MotA
LGSGIAVAFIATIYGVAFANLLFIPLANRIKIYVFRRTRLYEMYLMGLMALLNGDSPKSIEMKMRSFYVKSSLHD